MTSAALAASACHAAIMYESDDDLRARVPAFLQAGLDDGETVVAIVPQRTGQILSEALGDGAELIQWGLPGMSYQHLGRASEALRAYLADRRAAGAPTRMLAENDVYGGPRGPGRMAGYLRAEAAATGLYAGYGCPWLCLYDQRQYAAEVLADAARVHPRMLDTRGRSARNADYIEPAVYLAAHPGPLSAVPAQMELDLPLTGIGDLAAARHQAGDISRRLGLPAPESRIVEVAAGEVIANAFRHGTMPGRVRVWRDGGAVIIRVDSGGPGDVVATSGFGPPDLSRGCGAGLWVARQLSDVVHVETRPDGTSVELQFPLP